MPNYWKNASDFLNSNLINTSVVIFPEKTGFYDWDKGLIMSHPEKILFKRYALTMIQDEYLNQEEHILHKKMIHQFSNLEKIMNENGYGLLLYEDDVMPVSRNFKEQEIYKNFFNFIEKGNFELIFSEGKIKIYKINDKNFKFNLNVL